MADHLLRALSSGLGLLGALLLGALLGWAFERPLTGALAGLSLSALLLLARHAWHAGLVLSWLRAPQTREAPRTEGFWGELAYRLERALREQSHAVQRERERLDEFLAAIEASPNGVMLLDAGEQITWCNATAAQHFGLNPERDLLQRVTNLVRAPAFVAYLHQPRLEEGVVFVAPDMRSTLSVLARPYGEGQMLLLSQDVTERERSDAMRRDFVANVSHEIRTPLTVLAGFVETLQQLPLSEAERQRVFALMSQQTLRMQSLVSDLLQLAQLEGSPRPGTERWIPLAPLLDRARADALALSDGRHAIELRQGPPLEVAVSEGELLSAVGNLLGNAVRYTPAGGSISLAWLQRDDGALHIEVRDTGPGIAREHLPRLTERFYRVDGSRSRETGGTGLGLSIVKHVMQRHGGEIDVQSELGKGSCFRLMLPALRVRRAPHPLNAAAAATA